MSRRDTIIIAVLLNAAILAVLFMMAVSSDDDIVSDQPEITHEIVRNEEPLPPPEPSQEPIAMGQDMPADEVDRALNDFAASNPVEPIISDEESQPEKAPEVQSSDEKPKQSSDRIVEVTVKKGDALERIARANGTTVDAVKKENNLKTERLKIGQVLRVPVGTVKKSTEAKKNNTQIAATAPVTGSGVEYYTVKSGDNPWKIAKKFNVKMDDLLKMNNLDEEKARNMKVGDKIRVR